MKVNNRKKKIFQYVGKNFLKYIFFLQDLSQARELFKNSILDPAKMFGDILA